jgi:protein-L-isoaspartate(D-aspartate) O-methyltransferase
VRRRNPDPVYLYTDDVIGILPERNLNNGQPSLHAALIAVAAPQPGEHVGHVGAGLGYYTAILAELVGRYGEGDGDRIRWRARRPRYGRRRMTAWCTAMARESCSNPSTSSYVYAGATRSADAWLDRLKEGGKA